MRARSGRTGLAELDLHTHRQILLQSGAEKPEMVTMKSLLNAYRPNQKPCSTRVGHESRRAEWHMSHSLNLHSNNVDVKWPSVASQEVRLRHVLI